MGLSLKRLRAKEEICDFLMQDRLYAAYAVCDLEPALFGQCEWYAAARNGGLTALCLLFTGLPPDRVFLMGSEQDLEPVLAEFLAARKAYVACRPQHLGALSRFYSVGKIEVMSRMVLRPERFTPTDGPVRRLGPNHVHSLQDLYRWYGDVAFAPYQLDQGVFYGIEQDGNLVATAGTHLVSRDYRLGIVGNVFTHPDYRGKGYAEACTSAVVEELLSLSLDVVLNVGQRNKVASGLYRRLGFEAYCSFVETLGVHRDLD
jgi:ribosomal protein S18 acetylase RimI-like enzyme